MLTGCPDMAFCITALSRWLEPVLTNPLPSPPFPSPSSQLTYHTNLDRLPRHRLLHHSPEPVD